MTPGDVTFEPGDRVALVGGRCVVLVAVSVDDPVIARLWALLSADAAVGDVLEELSAGGIRSLPAFVLIERAGRSIHAVARGAGVLEASVAGTARRFSGAGMVAWQEAVIHDVDGVVATVDDEAPAHAAQAGYLVGRGIVPARAVAFGLPLPGIPAAEPASVVAAVPPVAAPEPVEPASDVEPPAQAVGPPADVPRTLAPPTDVVSIDAPVTNGLPTDDVPDVDPPARAVPEAVAAEPDGSPGVAAPAVAALDAEATVVFEEAAPVAASAPPGADRSVVAEPEADDYGHLFGATVFRSVEGAVRQRAEQEAAAELAPPPARLIDGPPPAATPTPLGDHDGHTIKIDRAALARARAAAYDGDHDGHTVKVDRSGGRGRPAEPAGQSAPMVLAAFCASGHPNPPAAIRCLRCSAEVPRVEPVLVARPSLGRLRFSDGVVVDLAGTSVIGRKPQLSGTYGSQLPNLVTVRSPLENVSKSHLEVRVQDWLVHVVDLGSSNGTELTLPGRQPQRLFPNQPALIEPGARIVLGGEVTAVFEGPTVGASA